MILNHLWGLYAHPKQEWHTIDTRHESLRYSMIHIMLIALIPALCAYYSAVHLGWSIGTGERITLTAESARIMALGMYIALIAGVFILAFLANWMALTFGAKPNYTQTLELAAYTATPMFMVGFAGLYPELWVIVLAGLVGLTYSIYLLYVGVPIIMHIPEDRGFIYASSVVTAGMVLLICILAGTVILWNNGFGPAFSH